MRPRHPLTARKKKNQSHQATVAQKVRWRRIAMLGFILMGLVASYQFVPPAVAGWTTIHHVSISGAKFLKRGTILSLLDLPSESSLLTINTAALAKRIEAHPRIASASIGRALPHTLTVVIREREPVAAVRHAGGQLFVDQEGVVLSIAPDDELPKLSSLSGLSAIKLLEGDPTTREQVRFGVTVIHLLQKQFNGPIRLEFRGSSEVVAGTKDVKFLVSQDVRRAWQQYLVLEPTIQAELPTQPYEIDLRYSDKVIVRQRG